MFAWLPSDRVYKQLQVLTHLSIHAWRVWGKKPWSSISWHLIWSSRSYLSLSVSFFWAFHNNFTSPPGNSMMAHGKLSLFQQFLQYSSQGCKLLKISTSKCDSKNPQKTYFSVYGSLSFLSCKPSRALGKLLNSSIITLEDN